MTLNELIESDSRLKNWKIISEDGIPGFFIPQAGHRGQFVSVAEFRDESQPIVRLTTRIGPADRLEPNPPSSAPELNLRLAHGFLALGGEIWS